MTDFSLKVYNRLPPRAQSLAASVRGYYLRSWRYSHQTDGLVAEAGERESWSPSQWKAWQDNRLRYVLNRAATQVPHYREQWANRRRNGDMSSWEVVENWPILEKDSVRASPTSFVADDCNRRRMFHDHTSGTSGKSLDLWLKVETVRQWYALFEARCRNWHGVTRNDRWAILGGQLVTQANKRRPPFWVWNSPLKQLYMSSYHLAPDLIPYYLDALKDYRIQYILGYTSSIYELAYEALRLGRRDLKMAVVLTNAEPVFAYQRKVIAKAFQCQVRETYGMAELVTAASECEAGQMHIWPEVGYAEVLDEDDRPVSKGGTGDLVCTSLLNADMPLIRYRVGDSGRLSGGVTACSCGRTLPIMISVEGRKDDILYTPDGRRIGRLDPVFKSQLPVREAQVIQESLGSIRVRYVPAPNFSEAARLSIVKRLQERMGNVEVILERVEEVPRGTNGKFRTVICKLTSEQKQAALGEDS